MRKIVVTGRCRLSGEVRVSGSKNAALPILAATILLQGESIIKNIPALLDVTTIVRVLNVLGLRAEYSDPNTVRVSTNSTIRHVAPYELVTKMRASFFIIGPILARMGLAKVPLPGGCAIGSRPVDLHIKGLEALGAKVHMEHGFVIVEAKRLIGARVCLDFPSVGATESIMMAASLADGRTLIENAAQEPEIEDLANFLNKAGARISGAGTDRIEIDGVARLKGIEYKIIPDRIEAGTLMIAAAITKGDVLVKGIIPRHLEAVINKLREAGINVEIKDDEARISAKDGFSALDVKTMPYPGFPTDMQAQFAVLLSLANGTSVVTESVFENRFMHIHELKRMGADIKIEGRSAIIKGVSELSGAPVHASDLRAGAALIIAGLAADGETIVDDIDRHIERGYEKIVDKFSSLGGNMKIIR
ncbi:MAG: UDP-N-acetylglucosamine 1-carboxyvinyltransferase [Candidatus Saganbacteria bacterium]|nr:UDP-N-acetylglucosamine 1-carboxyvinyltransferase [Candidatus Saganbacteria bacterium]